MNVDALLKKYTEPLTPPPCEKGIADYQSVNAVPLVVYMGKRPMPPDGSWINWAVIKFRDGDETQAVFNSLHYHTKHLIDASDNAPEYMLVMPVPSKDDPRGMYGYLGVKW